MLSPPPRRSAEIWTMFTTFRSKLNPTLAGPVPSWTDRMSPTWETARVSGKLVPVISRTWVNGLTATVIRARFSRDSICNRVFGFCRRDMGVPVFVGSGGPIPLVEGRYPGKTRVFQRSADPGNRASARMTRKSGGAPRAHRLRDTTRSRYGPNRAADAAATRRLAENVEVGRDDPERVLGVVGGLVTRQGHEAVVTIVDRVQPQEMPVLGEDWRPIRSVWVIEVYLGRLSGRAINIDVHDCVAMAGAGVQGVLLVELGPIRSGPEVRFEVPQGAVAVGDVENLAPRPADLAERVVRT